LEIESDLKLDTVTEFETIHPLLTINTPFIHIIILNTICVN
jgi:hypothetical protein